MYRGAPFIFRFEHDAPGGMEESKLRTHAVAVMVTFIWPCSSLVISAQNTKTFTHIRKAKLSEGFAAMLENRHCERISCCRT